MSPNKFRQTECKTLHFYCFWRQQYSDRNSGIFCEGDSLRYISNICRGYEPEGHVLDWYKLAWSALRKCKFLGADESSITLKIEREADDATILNAVHVWRCFKKGPDGQEGYILEAPYIFTKLYDAAQYSIEANPSAAFNPNQWASRAIGLWLWDYVSGHGGKVIAAIRAMKTQLGPEIEALGFAASEENVFRRFYRKTAECIEACEVLPFK